MMDFLRCELRGAMKYILGLEVSASPSEEASIGTVVHAFQARRMAKIAGVSTSESPEDALERACRDETAVARDRVWRRAEDIAAAYEVGHDVWTESDVLAIEETYAASMSDLGIVPRDHEHADEVITGDPDLVLRRRNGVTICVDWKTTAGKKGSLPSWGDGHNEHALSFQGAVYLRLLRLYHENVESFVIHRLLSIPPFKNDPNPVTYSTQAIEDADEMMRRAVAAEFRALARIRAAQRPIMSGMGTSACGTQRYGGCCEFLDFCQSTDPASQRALLAGWRRKEMSV